MGEKKSVVAPRNDLDPHPVEGSSNPYELEGKDPRFAYQAFSTNPRHPSFVGHAMRAKRCAGGKMSQGWTPCQDDLDPELKQLHPREDQGKGISGALYAGSQIVCKIPIEDWHLRQAEDKAEVADLRRQMKMPEPAPGTRLHTTIIDSDSAKRHQAQSQIDPRRG